jgi:hypothetical protein
VEYFRRATVHMLSHKAEYGMLTDRLGRAFHRLELKRQPRDVTPTLSEYFPPHGSPAVVCGATPASWSATAWTSTSRSSWSRTATRRTSAMSSTLWTYAVDTGVQNAMAATVYPPDHGLVSRTGVLVKVAFGNTGNSTFNGQHPVRSGLCIRVLHLEPIGRAAGTIGESLSASRCESSRAVTHPAGRGRLRH